MAESNKTLANIQSTFGGLILSSDFDTQKGEYHIADRIISDWRFDEKCRQNIEMRKRLQPLKTMEEVNEKNAVYTCKSANQRTY